MKVIFLLKDNMELRIRRAHKFSLTTVSIPWLLFTLYSIGRSSFRRLKRSATIPVDS